jgi:hypothetical protein
VGMKASGQCPDRGLCLAKISWCVAFRTEAAGVRSDGVSFTHKTLSTATGCGSDNGCNRIGGVSA